MITPSRPLPVTTSPHCSMTSVAEITKTTACTSPVILVLGEMVGVAALPNIVFGATLATVSVVVAIKPFACTEDCEVKIVVKTTPDEATACEMW